LNFSAQGQIGVRKIDETAEVLKGTVIFEVGNGEMLCYLVTTWAHFVPLPLVSGLGYLYFNSMFVTAANIQNTLVS
jgi:hypothetical protein